MDFGHFFAFGTPNLLSFVLGTIWALVTYRWNPWKTWLWVVLYFAGVGVYFALKANGYIDAMEAYFTLP